MSVSPATVKALREKTNAGMMDCKKALEEASGNMEAAMDLLRKKGLAIAQKKSGRQTQEGMLGSFFDAQGKQACLVEVNCETDFVVKTKEFQNFVSKLTQLICKARPKDLEALLKEKLEGTSVQGKLEELIATIGENMQIKRFELWEATGESQLGMYLHAGSKIGVIVSIDLKASIASDALKEIAMHIAAMNPKYVRPQEVSQTILEKEKEILRAGVDPKKPKEIQDKIIEGKLKKFFSEECLEEQIFIKDPEGKKTVKEWLAGLNPQAKIERFVRMQIGT